jgi:hypothetical protein
MRVVEFPVSEEAVEMQGKLTKRMLDALSGKAALTVTTKDKAD